MNDAGAHGAIGRLMADYCHFVDDRDLDAWLALFTDDAVLTIRHDRHVGRNQIGTWITHATSAPEARSRHFATNLAVDYDSDTHATCRSDFLVVARGGILAAGRYVDDVVRIGDLWRFQTRWIQLDP